MIQNLFLNWDFWFESLPSGNPGASNLHRTNALDFPGRERHPFGRNGLHKITIKSAERLSDIRDRRLISSNLLEALFAFKTFFPRLDTKFGFRANF
jgi:hypothetical protein